MNVVADSRFAGASTRQVVRPVKAPGIEGVSKSQVSRMAKTLDETALIPLPPPVWLPLHRDSVELEV